MIDVTSVRKLVAASLCAAAMAAPAAAATFDFQAIADGAGFNTTNGPVATGDEGSWASIVGGANVGIVNGGISVVASALAATVPR